MSTEYIIALIGLGIVMVTFLAILFKFVHRRAHLKPKKKSYRTRWRDLQKLCKSKETWPEAIISADKLLDKALIKKGFKGKSAGARIVSAQRTFTDNDGLWSAHKLSKKLQDDPTIKLTEKEVKKALLAFCQALKDLGAL